MVLSTMTMVTCTTTMVFIKMTNVDLSPTSRDDDVIIDISSSTTEEINREQLKLKFRLALIDDVDNKKTSEIKAKSDPDIPSSI
ncbi:unnamed protein product [Rotaria sordida]|uniref:Uncharacterized protein n=1 Tax=Rotaria sordida TaxID=392033 RepID=A0A814I5J3_9BILA|nr:unnamed protein product [Rotaria sordida]CAF1130331.1 unnamed protein product [Rotaria sordida]CAF1135865.1 unnamed protein product [Rotaria sordida]